MVSSAKFLVGKVFIIHGTVKAVSADGSERLLTANSPVYANEHIVTGTDGSVSIVFQDHQERFDLGRLSDVVVDEDVYGAASGHGDAMVQVEDMQNALQNENFDPTMQLPAPAAGETGGAGTGGPRGGGRQVVVFDADQLEVLPDSGAETTGITLDFLDPPPGGVQEPDGTDSTPSLVLTPILVEVQEDALAQGNRDTGIDTDRVNIDLASAVQADFLGDDPGSLVFTLTDPSGANSGLTSNGSSVYYYLENGELVARVGGVNGNVIFTLEVDSSTGQAVFDLDGALDHTSTNSTGSGDDQTLLITNLGQYITVTATDSDNDAVSQSLGALLTISVEDDVPVVEEGKGSLEVHVTSPVTENKVSSVEIQLDLLSNYIDFGADQPVHFALTAPASTATRSYFVNESNTSLVAMNNENTPVYSIHLDEEAGTATFNLHKVYDSTTRMNIDRFFHAVDADGDEVTLTNKIILYVEGNETLSSPSRATSSSAAFDGQDSLLTNEVDNAVTGSLGNYAIAGDAAVFSLDLMEKGSVTDSSGSEFTSSGQSLIWHKNTEGVWAAIVDGGDPDSDPIFTISTNSLTQTYSVNVAGKIDNNGGVDQVLDLQYTVSDSEVISHADLEITFDNDGVLDASGTSSGVAIAGGSGSEFIIGSQGDDIISGGGGDDIIIGAQGDDTVHGGTGSDIILGGSGNDLLEGNAGADTLIGGTGNDTFDSAEVTGSLETTDYDSTMDHLVGNQGQIIT